MMISGGGHGVLLTSLSTTQETTTKSILKNISGQAAAGSLVAIMGPTGSGKTSLLNVLAHRCPVVKGASLTGSLLVNNSKVDPKAFSHLTSYVQQDDAMFSALTVKETLMTAAHFQLPSSVTQSEKDDYVDSIINELGLNKCRDTIIGDAKERGVSGGGEIGLSANSSHRFR
jgi:ABC-type multidrug transport system ATPase subunit